MKNQKQEILKTTWFSVVGNIVLAALKFFAGFFGHSFALIADGIESTTDALTGVFVYFGLRYAQKPPDSNHPYGHGKAEALTTFMIVGFMLVSATVIVYQSIINFFTVQELPHLWTIYVMIGIVLWKEISYQWVVRRSKVLKSQALRADAWHHRSDAITTIAALVGVSLALLLGGDFVYADEVAAILAALFIYYNSFKILRPALGEVMDETMFQDLEHQIKETAKKVNGIKTLEKSRIRKSGLIFHVELHVHVDGDLSVTKGHDIAHELKDKLHDDIGALGIITIHVEPQ